MKTRGFRCLDCRKHHMGWFALRRAERHGRRTGHQATWWGVSTDKGRLAAAMALIAMDPEWVDPTEEER